MVDFEVLDVLSVAYHSGHRCCWLYAILQLSRWAIVSGALRTAYLSVQGGCSQAYRYANESLDVRTSSTYNFAASLQQQLECP